jgi:hypothetical protein
MTIDVSLVWILDDRASYIQIVDPIEYLDIAILIEKSLEGRHEALPLQISVFSSN